MDCDILIIGAGAAGLSCAQELVRAGKRVIVLEARDRTGGRVHTRRDRGVVESGAEFIHGEHAATWGIVEAEHLETLEWRPGASSFRNFSNGDGIRADSEALLTEMRALEEGAYDYHGPEISYKEFLAQKPGSEAAHFFASRHIGDLEAADDDQLSMTQLAEESAQATNGPRNFWITDGYDRVIEALARGIDVRLSHAVIHTEWQQGSVKVTCANGETFSAPKLVFTLPIGVLKKSSVAFTPALPAAFTESVEKIGFGNSSKVVLWLRERIEDFGMLDTAGHFGHFWPRMFGAEQVVVGYSGGSRADALVAMGKEAAIEEGIQEFCGAFGGQMRERIAHAEHYTWSDDPYALGSYSYSKIGKGNARDALRAPIDDTLYYAGEAVNTHGHTATVHGAIESGRDTARTILSV